MDTYRRIVHHHHWLSCRIYLWVCCCRGVNGFWGAYNETNSDGTFNWKCGGIPHAGHPTSTAPVFGNFCAKDGHSTFIGGSIIKSFKYYLYGNDLLYSGLDDENYLRISLTREELANIVGTATESVIRLLSEFKSDKIIELSGRKIKILDKRVLDKISNVFN